MKVSFNRASVMDVQTWEVADGSPQAVADLLVQGGEIRALCSMQGDKARFQSADWLFVEYQRSAAEVEALIEHPFTVQYASIAWIGGDGRGGQNCLIGFQLPQTVSDAARYKLLLSGLTTIYAAARPRGADHAWRCAGGGRKIVLQGMLDTAAVDKLETLGRENNLHRSVKGYVRSAVRLERDVFVRQRDGDAVALVSLDEGVAVHCPVHADTQGMATVIGQGYIKAVQCPVCIRNYWNVAPKRDVDFDLFRRVFDDLHTQELRTQEVGDGCLTWDEEKQFSLLREQYLPPLDLKFGVTMVRSPKGSGKTTVLKDLVDKCRARGLSVLLLGHRRALLRDQSQRIGLDLYFEMLDGGETSEFRSVRPTDCYAICLDSVPSRLRPDVHKFDVVLVDESEQVIRHLAGLTLKDERRQAFSKFKHYLSVAKAVYLLDADLSMLSLKFVQDNAHEASSVRFVVNEPEVEAREYDLVTTREGLLGKLETSLNEGKKCYLATNSKTAAEKIGLWAAERWKEKRIEVVTSDNAQQTRIQDLLCNIVEEFQTGRGDKAPLDLLIGSPAIGTGIDITFPGNAVVVDHVFGIFQSNITTHFDIDQQLGRVRHPGKVSVWINKNVMHYETAPEALRNELRNTVLRTDLILGYQRDGLPIYSDADRPMVNLWSEIVSYERASKNDLSRHWIALREANGWTGILDIGSDAEKERGKAALLEGNDLRDAARVERIVNAADIDEERADELKERAKAGAPMSVEDQASLEKYRLGDFYATEVNGNLVAFDDDGRTRRCVEMLEIMVGDSNFNQNIDRYEIDQKDRLRVIVFDRQYRSAKAELLAKLLVAAGLLDADSGEFLTSIQVSTEAMEDFISCFRENRKRVEAELGLDMRRDIEKKPVQQLGDVLALIGIDLTLMSVKKHKGVKRRNYGIGDEQVAAMMAVIVRRDEKRQVKVDLKRPAANDDGDNEPPTVNNDHEDQLSHDDGDRSEPMDAPKSNVSPIAARVAAMRGQHRKLATAAMTKPVLTINPRLDPNNLPFQV